MKLKISIIPKFLFILYFTALLLISLDWPYYTRTLWWDLGFWFHFATWSILTFPPFVGLVSVGCTIYKIFKKKCTIIDIICFAISVIVMLSYFSVIYLRLFSDNLIDEIIILGFGGAIFILINWFIKFIKKLIKPKIMDKNSK